MKKLFFALITLIAFNSYSQLSFELNTSPYTLIKGSDVSPFDKGEAIPNFQAKLSVIDDENMFVALGTTFANFDNGFWSADFHVGKNLNLFGSKKYTAMPSLGLSMIWREHELDDQYNVRSVGASLYLPVRLRLNETVSLQTGFLMQHSKDDYSKTFRYDLTIGVVLDLVKFKKSKDEPQS